MKQLALDMQPPRAKRTAGLRSFVPKLETVQEALSGEARAFCQEEAVLAVFRPLPPGTRLAPSEVTARLGIGALLTSVRRAMTMLTWKGILRHHKDDRRPGPNGARESVWSIR